MAATNAESLALSIVRKLHQNGFVAYLVGGCVRDKLLGTTPKDYDVATDARPQQILGIWSHAKLVGEAFGVVLITDADVSVEVATFRSDFDYHDGRHPSRVTFETDPRADALRRDFTINSLFMDPETGEVLDFTGGKTDLNERRVRAIGQAEERFREDYLRMLRAVRFAARLGFEIERETAEAIRKLAPKIADVSAERIRDEVVRILTEGGARRGFELLDDLGLLQQILPEVARMKGVEQPPEYHPEGDVWIHTLIMLDGLERGTSPTLAMGVLLHDVGKPPTFRVAERIRFDGHVEAGVAIAREITLRLRFSTDEREQIEALVENHMKFKDAPKMKDSTLKRFLRLERFPEHLELHRLDCESSHGMLDNHRYVAQRREEFGTEQISPPRLVNGRDLTEMGQTPGPLFGRVLREVEDAQLDGRVSTREEALALAAELIRRASEPAST